MDARNATRDARRGAADARPSPPCRTIRRSTTPLRPSVSRSRPGRTPELHTQSGECSRLVLLQLVAGTRGQRTHRTDLMKFYLPRAALFGKTRSGIWRDAQAWSVARRRNLGGARCRRNLAKTKPAEASRVGC